MGDLSRAYLEACGPTTYSDPGRPPERHGAAFCDESHPAAHTKKANESSVPSPMNRHIDLAPTFAGRKGRQTDKRGGRWKNTTDKSAAS